MAEKIPEPPHNVRRKVLTVAVGSLLMELGFESVDRMAIETLSEMCEAFIFELGQSSKNYCELNGRTEPVIADVILGLINMGMPLNGIEQHAKRSHRVVVSPLQQYKPHKTYDMLQAGVKLSKPSHIPNHLPTFPDPHAYIRTPTHKQPVTEYEAIREKAAQQKRDIERALTKFLCKTNETHNLFDSEDNNMFPLIACKPMFPSYLNALLPQDQIFDPEDLEYEPQPEQTEQPQNKKRIKSERKVSETNTQSDLDNSVNSESQKNPDEILNNSSDIDNPYLAATKMPTNDSNAED